MDEGTTGVIGPEGIDKPPARLEQEVEAIRDNLTGIVRELDHRRHELFDVRLQLRRHRAKVAIAAGIVLVLVGVSVALAVRQRRNEARALTRMRKMRRAIARFVDDPDRVAPPRPGIGRKALGAAAGSAAAVVAKTSAERLFARTRAP